MMSINRIKLLLKCYVDGNSTHPFIRKRGDPVWRLHSLAREEKHRLAAEEYGGALPPIWIAHLLQWMVWPCLSLRNALNEFFQPTKDLNRTWKHFIPDVSRMWWQAMRYNLSPFHFYVYRLHKPDWSWGKEPLLFTAWEFNFIGRRMTRLRGNDVGMLDNKDRFFEFCVEHEIQTIPVINLQQSTNLEKRDLFVKPVFGHSGCGCQILSHVSSSNCWKLGDAELQIQDIQAALEEYYEGESFIVCYRFWNHDDMKWLSSKVLTTLRILSAWNKEGGVDLLRATLRIPSTPEAFIDNSSQGGLSMPVDPATGEIIGTAKSWKKDFLTNNVPGSERNLIGFQLPLWDKLVELVQRAHRAADNYNFLGWDVAIAEEGVLISECNVWSDIELVQAPQWRPLLEDDVMDYFLLEKCLWTENE